jgi:hypothetical protein
MTFITTGLTKDVRGRAGVTTHYNFSYDNSLAAPAGPEPARTNAVIAKCENDYNLMSGWFGRSDVKGMNVQVTTQTANTCPRDPGAVSYAGGCWNGKPASSIVQISAEGKSYSTNPAYIRYLLVLEVVEIFMMAQGAGGGWWTGSGEGSKGEGLSRFLSSQFLVQNGFLGVGIDKDYAVADLWLNIDPRDGLWRKDYVNIAPDDHGYNATNGCTTLFIYYMFHQLGFSINQIVGAGASTLAGVYKNLTSDTGDPFQRFWALLDHAFRSRTISAVPGPNFDDPWPLEDLHVLAIDEHDGLWHTICKADGSWPFAFGDVQAQTRLVGPNPGIGPTPRTACATS